MFMRYRGGGVGHSNTRAATDFFKIDRHPRDWKRNQRDEMDFDDVDLDRHQGDIDGFDQDERLGSSDDPGSDVDEQDQGSNDEESNLGDDEEENDEEGDGDESETEQLGFSEL
jgi:hypothetical protein